MAYRLVFDPATEGHLRALTARQRSDALAAIRQQLAHQPTVETRNRFPMEPNSLDADWELRIGQLRVYYSVEDSPEPVVYILAVGIKRRERVFIGGEPFQL
jgi:hypothetical protein